MSQPLVSFVSPSFNHAKYIIESLESIRKQTYQNIEHIIIDDASEDDSVNRIENWIQVNNYSCRFIRHPKNKGISYTLNESIEMAKGEFWTVLATDDFIVPERTELFVNYLAADHGKTMIVSDSRFVDEESRELFRDGTSSFLKYYTQDRPDFSLTRFGSYESLLNGNYIPSSFMIRKEIFKTVGMYDTKLSVEDWDMWLRLSRHSSIGYIPQPLSYYRVHATNSIHNRNRINKSLIRIFLNQYSFCKKAGLKKNFQQLFEQNLIISPLKKPLLTFYFLARSPWRLYMKTFLKRMANKIFGRQAAINLKTCCAL